jgi:myo-inositol-1(or 4)-monophosphatase
MNLTKLDLAACRKFAVETAETAGRIVRNGFGGAIPRTAKGAAGDVVTSLDRAADRLIVDRLHRAFPSHRILSEESGTVWDSPGPWTWLVDPLDGSNNIVVGLPVAAIGLTLCHDSQPKVGVVHEPFVSRTSSAARGAGAWQGRDTPLLRRSTPSGRHPVVAWTQGYGVSPRDCTALSLRLALREYARRVLELWAPLCAWTMLARGDIEGIVGYNIGELDLHAGALIAGMTGIEIRAFNGSPFDTRFYGLAENRRLVAAAPERIDELLDLVSRPALDPIP